MIFIDVRVADAFIEKHITGAKNLCVYEIEFINQVNALPDVKDALLIVYGADSKFKAAEVAFKKLDEAGFTNIAILEGGLDAWCSANLARSESELEQPDSDGAYPLDVDKSKLRWIGRNLTNQHYGSIALKEGSLRLDKAGQPLGGTVVVDMQRIDCIDLEDSAMRKMLIGHLSHSDFFLVEKYPTAQIELKAFTPLEGTPGKANYSASGVLTVRGVAQAIALNLTVVPLPDEIVVQCQFELDRTQHGAIYGSGRFFERLGMHLVNDHVSLDVTAFFKISGS